MLPEPYTGAAASDGAGAGRCQRQQKYGDDGVVKPERRDDAHAHSSDAWQLDGFAS